MNILLIGGTGCLSSAVTAEALRQKISVSMLNRGNRPVPDGVELIKANCDDVVGIETLLRGRQFDSVIDFLCFNERQLWQSFNLYSKHCLQYVFISSCAVYANTTDEVKTEESSKVQPEWEYSVNKWKCEELLATLAKGSCCRTTVVRPRVAYGSTRIPYGISPKYGYHWTLVARAKAGKPLIGWNGGLNYTNMIRVEDFAVGVVGLLCNPKAYGEAFNICGDETPTYGQVLGAMESALGFSIPVIDVDSGFLAREMPERAGEILAARSRNSVCSNEKIKRVVPGFRQSIFIKEGVAMTLDAYLANGYQQGIDWKYDADSDRILRKWLALHGESSKARNLRFVDYLGNATRTERHLYYSTVYRDNRLFRFAGKVRRATNKIIGL